MKRTTRAATKRGPATSSPARRETITQQLMRRIQKDGVSPNSLAEAVGVDRRALDRWLAGEKGISGETVDRLGLALGLTLVDARRKGRPGAEAGAGD